MSEDFVVWDIDSILESYTDIPEWEVSVNRKLEGLFIFLETNGLLKCRVTDERGAVIKRTIRLSELNDEGKSIACGPKNPIHRWLASKGSQKNPPDMKMLEKALSEVRR
ncbi:hypothetical protein HG549_02640 [Pseudomonas sp. SK]|uniref:hypothetical protein n=1 Tax=Pseudomonas sp. SK TaxID=2729423 RepID=UPI001463E510|nr:hypothetical protein [Pseudomonas sp. SK]QJQ18887.1 hypothetical protein HG549_02640 [Pseudomonas sp. SK]